MESMNELIKKYQEILKHGKLQNAYRGILAFMSELKTKIELSHPDFSVSAIYPGYMDMSYFALVTNDLKKLKLKIAVVYLHAEGRFEGWLAGVNRQIQAETIEKLSEKNLGKYSLSQVQPGVDSIVSTVIAEKPDFDHPNELKQEIEERMLEFSNDMLDLVK